MVLSTSNVQVNLPESEESGREYGSQSVIFCESDSRHESVLESG